MKSDQKNLLDNLEKGDNAAIELLYKSCFPAVDFYVRKNKGTAEDARDIFQEAVVILLNKIRLPGFELTASLKTYLYAISKNLWLKQLRGNKQIIADNTHESDSESDPFDVEIYPMIPIEQKVQTW